MQGLHLTADLYQCTCQPDLLIQANAIANMCRRYTQQAGLTLVDEKWFTFPDYQGQPGGVTGMLLLAESHLAIHTWPEQGSVTLDVYVCNFSVDNTSKAQSLMRTVTQAFQPTSTVENHLLRGDSDVNSHKNMQLVIEELNPDAAFGYRSRSRVSTHTGLQKLEILETPQFGRVLQLDNHFMTSEAEEFFYHESLIHPATIAHPKPENALILGGGDGGAAEELLKHPSINHIVIAELDPGVIEASRAYLESIHKNAFDHPKVTLQIGDGVKFMEQTAERYDLIFMDLTDPDTPAQTLYTRSFFDLSRQVLTENGALILHLGSPIFHPERVKQVVNDLRSTFKQVHCYGLYIPLYGAYWGMAVASDTLNPKAIPNLEVANRLEARKITDLNYYNPETHFALFALPNYYQKLLQTD